MVLMKKNITKLYFSSIFILNINFVSAQVPTGIPGESGPLGNQGGMGSINWMSGQGGGAAGVVPPASGSNRGENNGAASGSAAGGIGASTQNSFVFTAGDVVLDSGGVTGDDGRAGGELLTDVAGTGGGGGGGAAGVVFLSSGNLTSNAVVLGGNGGNGGAGFHMVNGNREVWGYGGDGGGGTGIFFAGDTFTTNTIAQILGGQGANTPQRTAPGRTDIADEFRGGFAGGGVGLAFAGKRVINHGRISGAVGFAYLGDNLTLSGAETFSRAAPGMVMLSDNALIQNMAGAEISGGEAREFANVVNRTTHTKEAIIIYGNNNRIENAGNIFGSAFGINVTEDLIGQGLLIVGDNNNIINSGFIAGGFKEAFADPNTINQYTSRIIKIEGANNTIEIQKGFSFQGTEILSEGLNSTFKFGGTDDAEFFGRDRLNWDLAINGFQHYVADAVGATWLLGYKTTAADTWNITNGTLKLAPDPLRAGVEGDLSLAKLVTVDANLDVSGIISPETTVQRLQGGIAGTIMLGGKNLRISSASGETFRGIISGSGGVTVEGNTQVFTNDSTYTGTTNILSPANLQLGDGGTTGSVGGSINIQGTLTFNRSNNFTFNNAISGPGNIVKQNNNQITINRDDTAFTGLTDIRQGAILVNGALGGLVNIEAQGILGGGGTVGPVQNAGTIAPSLGTNNFNTLTINGEYVSSDGKLILNTQLMGDNSPTDRLNIIGNTGGITTVTVNNIQGAGAPTNNGILVVNVGGQSNGSFILDPHYMHKSSEPVVVAGAFSYALRKNGKVTGNDGNWYLQNTALIDPTPGPGPIINPDPVNDDPMFQPGVPLYSAENEILKSLNRDLLTTMYKRIGNRYWTGSGAARVAQGDGPGIYVPAPSAGNEFLTDYGFIWTRFEGWHGEYQPSRADANHKYSENVWNARIGIDGKLYEDHNGAVIGSIWGHWGKSKAKVTSYHGDGSVDTKYKGLGGALTWFGDTGLYVDLQAQTSWYRGDLESFTAGMVMMEERRSNGYGASIEVGKRIEYDAYWSFTPQAQLLYSSIRQKGMWDMFAAYLSGQTTSDFSGRVGVSANYETAWQSASGYTDRLDLRGFVNLSTTLSGKDERVIVSEVSIDTGHDNRVFGEIGVGATYGWLDGKYSVFGNVSTTAAFNDTRNNYNVGGALGLRVKW